MWIFVGAESLLATCVLAAGMTDDLRSKKVHNQLNLILFAISFIAAFAFSGLGSWSEILISVAISFCFIPLQFLGILGGGDIKLVIAASPLMGPWGVVYTLIYSLFIGAGLGLIRALLNGQLFALLLRTQLLAKSPKSQDISMDRIPYTIALLLGWLTYLSLTHYGVHHV